MPVFLLVTPPAVAALPRRPLTIGELLDAAAQLVRRRAWVLIPLALALAAAEQLVMIPARRALGVDFVYGFNDDFFETVNAMWLATTLGCGLEAFIVIVLGTWSGRAAAEDLAGAGGSPWALLRPRWGRLVAAALLVAPIAGAFTAAGIFLGPLWIIGFGLFGLAGVAMGMEQRGPLSALGRAAGAGMRNGMRATWVRILGYLAWVVLRLGFLLGVTALTDFVPLTDSGIFWLLTAGIVLANAIAYVFLAGLDAATLAEGRFRSEGLDVWLNWSQRHAPITVQDLAARR